MPFSIIIGIKKCSYDKRSIIHLVFLTLPYFQQNYSFGMFIIINIILMDKRKNQDQSISENILQTLNSQIRQKSIEQQMAQTFKFLQTPQRQIDTKNTIQTQCQSFYDRTDKSSTKSIDDNLQNISKTHEFLSLHQIDFRQHQTESEKHFAAQSRVAQTENKLINHFSKTIKIDKYLRLVSSIIKTYRAYCPKTKLNNTYKQIILIRRIIRQESKYDTMIDLFKQQNNWGMRFFKLLQIIGDFVDGIGLWLKIIFKGTVKHEKIIDQLQQIESNFYFGQCCIWLIIYLYRYFELMRKNKGQSLSQEDGLKKSQLELKSIKYLLDIVTSYNNSSLKKRFGEVNHKIAGYLTIISSLIGLFLLWK